MPGDCAGYGRHASGAVYRRGPADSIATTRRELRTSRTPSSMATRLRVCRPGKPLLRPASHQEARVGDDVADVGSMTDNSAMGVYQLVEVAPEVGRPDVQVLPSVEGADPTAFDHDGQRPLYLGSADLLDLVISLRRKDYEPYDVAVADARFERVDPKSVEEQTTALLSALKQGDLSRSHEILARDLGGLIIEALTVRGTRSHRGNLLRLLQDGVIDVVNSTGNTSPIEDVRRALLAQ